MTQPSHATIPPPTSGDRQRSPWRAEIVASLALAGPFALMQLAQISINVTLLLMVGRLGATELAGIALGLQSFLVVFLFSLGLSIAVAPLVAQARGAGTLREVRSAVCQGLWATALMALPSGLLLWFSGPLLLAAGQEASVAAAASDFARPMAVGLLGWLWFFVFRNYMGAMGRPAAALYVMIAAILLNGLLGYALIFGRLGLPALGVFGAGLTGAVIGWLLCLGLLACALFDRRLRRLRLLAVLHRPNWPMLREIFRLGAPIGLAMLFETLLFMAVLHLQGLISTVAQAAHAITMQLAAMAFMVPLGLSQAATVRVGLAVGQRDVAQARRAAAVSFAAGFAFTMVAALIFLLLPTTLVRQFLDMSLPESPAVLATTLTFLAIAAAFQFLDGTQMVALGVLRGLKDIRMPTIITCVGYWVIGFPLAALLGFVAGWDGVGIWLGLTAGLAVAAPLMVLRVRRSLSNLERLMAHDRLPTPAGQTLALPV